MLLYYKQYCNLLHYIYSNILNKIANFMEFRIVKDWLT